MKQIPAWQAEDGKKFFEKAECDQHEANKLFSAWYYLGHQIYSEESHEVFNWLKAHAEDIRSFLPPVATKPELDIEVMRCALQEIAATHVESHEDATEMKALAASALHRVLPPVAAKPEINIKDLDYKVLFRQSFSGLFNVEDVEKWLAGELE